MKKLRETNGNIVSVALLLGVASLGSRLAGLVRERALTTTFGAGDVFDAFVAAFRVPDFIFNAIVVGALSAAFIPLFTEKLLLNKENGKQEAFRFSLAILNMMLLLVIGVSALYVLFAPYIVPLITPGFSGEKLTMTIQLSRIMALQPIFLSISFVFSGVLNSFKRFVVYALAPILYNVGIIIGVLIFVPRWGVAGLGWGVVLGASLHLLVQLPSMLVIGWRWQPIFGWSSEDVRKLWRMVVPRFIGLAGQQINLLTVTVIGSTLTAGSLAIFHLASNVQSLPIGVIGIAFAQAAFPTMAEQMARNQEVKFRHTLTRSFRYILFFIMPLSVFFFLLRAQIVRVLFGAGQFDWNDTIMTFQTLGYLLISLFAQATIPLLARAFYVRQDTFRPAVISIISVVLNIVLALVLAPSMGVRGLALAFSISAIVQLILLLATLHWQLGDFDDATVLWSVARIALAAILAGGVVQALKIGVEKLVDMERFWGVFMQATVAFIGGAAAYLLICLVLRCDELTIIRRYITRKPSLPAGTETPRFSGISD